MAKKEVKTDLWVYDLLKQAEIQLDAQGSNIKEIDEALKTASKKGTGNVGFPEYVGATNRNNGILSFVQADKNLIQKGNAIGFIKNGNGSAGYSIYKAEKFAATSDVIFGYAEWLNKYIGLFITSCSDMSQEKYSHGYKWTKERLLKSKIILPIDEQENPDYEYMEKYSKNLLREKIQNYISYAVN